MLTATHDISLGRARYRGLVLIDRVFRAHLAIRDRLVFDTRYASPAANDGRAKTHIYLLVEGRMQVRGAPTEVGPIAYLLRDDELDRVDPARSRTFRTDGERCSIVHLQVDGAHVPRAPGLANGAVPISPVTVECARVLLASFAEARFGLPEMNALLLALEVDGLVTSALSTSLSRPEDPRIRRLWSALSPHLSAFAPSVTLKELAASLDISVSQLARDVLQFTSTYAVPTKGFRSAMHVLRLRASALLLGAQDVTVAAVAERVGYGSTIAMDRAFRDAKLPSPSEVQRALLDPPA